MPCVEHYEFDWASSYGTFIKILGSSIYSYRWCKGYNDPLQNSGAAIKSLSLPQLLRLICNLACPGGPKYFHHCLAPFKYNLDANYILVVNPIFIIFYFVTI